MISRLCDCGSPATHRDGSGWFCEDCRAWVERITNLIEQKIKEERGLDTAHKSEVRRRNYRLWYLRNKQTMEYHRIYNRLYARGYRDYGLHRRLREELAA